MAEAFLAFLHSTEGQRILADYGFRPVNGDVTDPASADKPPLPAGLFTMAELGGWKK